MSADLQVMFDRACLMPGEASSMLSRFIQGLQDAATVSHSFSSESLTGIGSLWLWR